MLILVALLVQSCIAFHLAPVRIEYAEPVNIRFRGMEHDENGMMIELRKQSLHTSIEGLEDQYLQTISREINLALGMTNTIHHLRWEVTITPNMGVMRVFNITADIDGLDVHIIGRHAKLIQDIPDQYDVVGQCVRTGSRPYGFAGPREKECSYHHIKRELHPHEIEIINQNLMLAVEQLRLS